MKPPKVLKTHPYIYIYIIYLFIYYDAWCVWCAWCLSGAAYAVFMDTTSGFPGCYGISIPLLQNHTLLYYRVCRAWVVWAHVMNCTILKTITDIYDLEMPFISSFFIHFSHFSFISSFFIHFVIFHSFRHFSW